MSRINLEGGWIDFKQFYPIFVNGQDYENALKSTKYSKCNNMQKINNTWYLRGNPHGKNHGLVSKPHSNLESTKCVNRLQPNPGSNHTPT